MRGKWVAAWDGCLVTYLDFFLDPHVRSGVRNILRFDLKIGKYGKDFT